MTQTQTDQKKNDKPSFVGTVLRRLLVHAVGATTGLLVGNVQTNSTATVLTYLGVICLVPRGAWQKPSWYIPVAIGLLQTLAAFLLGVPPADAIFLGGIQSWLQRLWQQKGRLCWDWIMAPILIICLDSINYGRSLAITAVSVLAIFGIGALAQYISNRSRAEQILEEEFSEARERLNGLIEKSFRPENILSQAKTLALQAEKLSQVLTGHFRENTDCVHAVVDCVKKVAAHVEATKPSKRSGWSKGLLESENWGKKTDTTALLTALQETNKVLTETLRRLRAENKDTKSADAFESTLAAFEESATDLLQKAPLFPAHLTGHIESIAQSTFAILKSMREDPADRAPGEKFLSRYLAAVHKILEEYNKLASGPGKEDVRLALQKSEEILERMDTAFKDELASLMQNDAINLTAEVDAIDTMLKMKGH